MAIELQTINQVAAQIVASTGLTPLTFFLAGSLISILLIIFDIETKQFSLNLPGRTQLGLAATIFIASALISTLSQVSVEQFILRVRSDIIFGLIITTVAGLIIRNRR